MEKRPALMLPMGADDWERGIRLDFLKSVRALLEKSGWCIGVEIKGWLGDWCEDCFAMIRHLGGRVTWHPSIKPTYDMHGSTDVLPERTHQMVDQASRFKDFIEAITIHLPSLLREGSLREGFSIDPTVERYYSPVDAEEMLAHIKSQVEPLKKLNGLLEGKLYIENIPLTSFRGGCRLPTYLSLSAGSFLDLFWLKKQTGVNVTFDNEHFSSACNLLYRRWEFEGLPSSQPVSPHELSPAERELHEVAGYWLKKGEAPIDCGRHMSYIGYASTVDPRLFHLGSGEFDANNRGQHAGHLPFEQLTMQQRIYFRWVVRRLTSGIGIGAVVEVCGGDYETDQYGPWSERIANDELAKMTTFLKFMDIVEKCC